MKQGRWIAVAVCSILVALATGLLYVALSREIRADEFLRFAPYLSLALFVVTPLAAAWLSGTAAWVKTGGGGLALGIATTVLAAGLNSGGTGVMPLALGIAVSGIVGMRAHSKTAIWLRLAVTVLVAVYAVASGRLVTLIFIYPLLGFADELADITGARRRPREKEPAARS